MGDVIAFIILSGLVMKWIPGQNSPENRVQKKGRRRVSERIKRKREREERGYIALQDCDCLRTFEWSILLSKWNSTYVTTYSNSWLPEVPVLDLRHCNMVWTIWHFVLLPKLWKIFIKDCRAEQLDNSLWNMFCVISPPFQTSSKSCFFYQASNRASRGGDNLIFHYWTLALNADSFGFLVHGLVESLIWMSCQLFLSGFRRTLKTIMIYRSIET